MERREREVEGRDARRGRTTVTLEDVARAAGVHYSTVSRALDPGTVRRVSIDTRKHVQAVAKKMGYLPDMVASGLKKGRTQTVAVIAGERMKGHRPCPCGCGRKFRKCHGPVVFNAQRNIPLNVRLESYSMLRTIAGDDGKPLRMHESDHGR